MPFAIVVLSSGTVLWLEGEPSTTMDAALTALVSFGARRVPITHASGKTRLGAPLRWPDAFIIVQQPAAAIRVQELRTIGVSRPIFVLGCGEQLQPDNADWEAELLAAGADGWCLSPSREHGFMSRLQALLRCGSGEYATPSRDLVELHAHTRMLVVSNRAIALSGRELDLIRYLYERAGSWVSKEQLFREIFGAPLGYDSSLIRTHVSNIRRKLNEHAWLLRTNRELGVMLLGSPDTQSRAF